MRQLTEDQKDKKVKEMIRLANKVIGEIKQMQQVNIDELNEFVYATSAVLTKRKGIKLKKMKMKSKKKQPAWKERIEADIQKKRGDLSALSKMTRGNEISQRRSRRMKRKYDIKIQHDITNIMEKIKQEIQPKAQRVRRYVKGSKYHQNKGFVEDGKKFYRELGKKTNKSRRTTTKGTSRTVLAENMGK